MFEVQELHFAYPGRAALFAGLSRHFPGDKKILLQGGNGCGKSTLLKLLCARLEPDSGKISRAPQASFYLPQEAEARILGITLQDDLSIWQMAGLDSAAVLQHPLIGGFGEGLQNLALRELSKGAKQAYLLSVALSLGHYLVLDEPFTALDQNRAGILSDYLRQQQGWLVVSHTCGDLNPDIVLNLEHGKLR
jgi:ATPase subunit of ABC transporter with duplicated ATPase domains